jgi:hypothetical protein
MPIGYQPRIPGAMLSVPVPILGEFLQRFSKNRAGYIYRAASYLPNSIICNCMPRQRERAPSSIPERWMYMREQELKIARKCRGGAIPGGFFARGLDLEAEQAT